MNFVLVAVFGVLVAVSVGSAIYFRRRSLPTASRIGLSLAAIGLLGLHFVREHNLTVGTVALMSSAAVILGSGIWYLRRAEQERPRSE